MKTFSLGVLALLAMSNVQEAQAVQLKAEFVDDIVRMLAESDKKEEEEARKADAAAHPERAKEYAEKTAKPEKKDTKATAKDSKKDAKKEDDLPLDPEAIKAYSSVIADAAEDSEPAKPVVYTTFKDTENQAQRAEHPPTL